MKCYSGILSNGRKLGVTIKWEITHGKTRGVIRLYPNGYHKLPLYSRKDDPVAPLEKTLRYMARRLINDKGSDQPGNRNITYYRFSTQKEMGEGIIEAINQTKSRGGTQIMKQCPECRAFYPEDMIMCPPCGVALISNEASSEDSNGGVFAPSSMYSVRYMGKDIITSVYHEREKEDYNRIPRTYVEIKDAQNPQRCIRIPMTGNHKIEARDALIGFMGEAYFHYLFPDLYEASFHEFIYFVLTKTW